MVGVGFLLLHRRNSRYISSHIFSVHELMYICPLSYRAPLFRGELVDYFLFWYGKPYNDGAFLFLIKNILENWKTVLYLASPIISNQYKKQ